jgi:hypothetical protein
MTSTTGSNEVLKQDRRGRVRVPRERQEALLAEFASSGLSAAEFARMAGVKYATFANWVQKRRRREAEAGVAGASVHLLEAIVEEGGECRGRVQGIGLLLELPGGCRLRVETPMQLAMAAELIKLVALGSRGC